MSHYELISSKPTPLPAQLSEPLRHISRKLNERGFVLRKRDMYVIEPMTKIATKSRFYGLTDPAKL